VPSQLPIFTFLTASFRKAEKTDTLLTTLYSAFNFEYSAFLLNSSLLSLSIFFLISDFIVSKSRIPSLLKSVIICHPNSVRNGCDTSPISCNLKATSSNSGTILPTPKAGSLPPLTAVDLSSENRSATSEKSSPEFNFS
jgi:hypothetical protein